MKSHYVKVLAQQIAQGFTKDDMYVLLLLDPETMVEVPVLIGEHEAEMIVIEDDKNNPDRPKRPLTHQLVPSLCNAFHLELQRVSIDRYYEGVFYANLHVSDGISVQQIDCRVSDAVAIALLEGKDIWIEKSILKETGRRRELSDILDIPDDPVSGLSLHELEQEIKRCEANEDYEKAAKIVKQIEAMIKGKNN